MNPTSRLHDVGQSIWLDDIRKDMLDDGTLADWIKDLSVTGLTSNPTIFDKAISDTELYDEAIAEKAADGASPEEIFFHLAFGDLSRAAALFLPEYERTDHVDGVVSLEVSPTLADDTDATIAQARELWERKDFPNLLVKVPGTEAGLPAIEELTYEGVSINVTLLFSTEQYTAAAEAFVRGLERRLEEGKDLDVTSVASVFISRWDVPANEELPADLHNKLGIAVATEAYAAYRDLLATDRWKKLADAGARPQRLLFASTGTKDPNASDVLYIEAFAAPDTVNTMPGDTLKAFADHGEVGEVLPTDGGNAKDVQAEIEAAGVDVDALATKLQIEGRDKFIDSWNSLMSSIQEQAS